MFKQVEYSEILFKNSLVNFGRCAHDESLIGNELPYRSRLIIRFIRQWSRMVDNFFSNFQNVYTTEV